MSRTVFVLGAGASVHCGTPVMDNFLEVAQDLLRLGEVEEVKEDFNNVFEAIGNLHAIQSKARINTYNVEDVYAAFEMGKLLGSLPRIEDSSKIDELISSIKKVIGYTLEKTTELPSDVEVDAPQSYYEFTSIIDSMTEARRYCSVITFNYDLGLDYSLHRRGILSDYGLGDIDMTDKKHIPFLKLHGSLNFAKCANVECGRITPYREFQYTERTRGASYSTIPVIHRLQRIKCSTCGASVHEDPFIVPPTWNKTAHHEQIEEVWKRAAYELRDAENIFVLGYSLPETDMFFRYLFALGVEMRTILRGFYVYNPDTEVKERFENLLGSGIEQRFQFYSASFEDAVGEGPSLNIGYKALLRQILAIG